MKRIIEPLFLCGDDELGRAIGITSSTKLKGLRDQGLPYLTDGKSFFYDPIEVRKFLTKLWQPKQVKL